MCELISFLRTEISFDCIMLPSFFATWIVFLKRKIVHVSGKVFKNEKYSLLVLQWIRDKKSRKFSFFYIAILFQRG